MQAQDWMLLAIGMFVGTALALACFISGIAYFTQRATAYKREVAAKLASVHALRQEKRTLAWRPNWQAEDSEPQSEPVS